MKLDIEINEDEIVRLAVDKIAENLVSLHIKGIIPGSVAMHDLSAEAGFESIHAVKRVILI